MNTPRRIKVLVVDDSAVARRSITEALEADPELEVVGTAADPYVARDKILELHPDVLTLDIEMPRMDGLSFLRILQKHRPMPVIIISSIAQAQSKVALEALECGAVDVVAKPSSAWSIGALASELPRRIKGAAGARIRTNLAAASCSRRLPSPGRAFHPRQLIVMGASTGGVEALTSVLTNLPAGLPGICVVQHMPPVFSKYFAERLNTTCAFEIREAAHGDVIKPNLGLIAPGDSHMGVRWSGDHYEVFLTKAPPVNFVRPAVDVLFESVAAFAGKYGVGALLTGMGKDGAAGLRQMRSAGAHTIAQNEETCTVYGMPKAAVELKAAARILPLEQIPHGLVAALSLDTATPKTQTYAN